MIKFKTKKTVPRYDEYNRHLGDFTMRMIITEVKYQGDQFMPVGEYYYIDNNGNTISVKPIKINHMEMSRENVRLAETQLPPLETNSLFDIMDMRIVQFAFIKWQMENGSSFGLMADDWEIDVE